MSDLPFFQTRASEVMFAQIQTALKFYNLIEKIIVDAGLEDKALTVFDLEDLLTAIPGMTEEFSIAVTQLASNNGKEYVSAHEIRSRAQEFTKNSFKMTYLGFLLYRNMITPEDVIKRGLIHPSLVHESFKSALPTADQS